MIRKIKYEKVGMGVCFLYAFAGKKAFSLSCCHGFVVCGAFLLSLTLSAIIGINFRLVNNVHRLVFLSFSTYLYNFTKV